MPPASIPNDCVICNIFKATAYRFSRTPILLKCCLQEGRQAVQLGSVNETTQGLNSVLSTSLVPKDTQNDKREKKNIPKVTRTYYTNHRGIRSAATNYTPTHPGPADTQLSTSSQTHTRDKFSQFSPVGASFCPFQRTDSVRNPGNQQILGNILNG